MNSTRCLLESLAVHTAHKPHFFLLDIVSRLDRPANHAVQLHLGVRSDSNGVLACSSQMRDLSIFPNCDEYAYRHA